MVVIQYHKPKIYWISLNLLLIFLMVLIGGITRLTDSGLSMTEWSLITGIIPPVYFAQVQGQLEVCDLEYCDFLECEIREYNNKLEFFQDTNSVNPLLRENGNEKGIVIVTKIGVISKNQVGG